MTLPVLWTSNISNSPIEKKEFTEYLYNNQRLLNRLRDILQEKEDGLERIESSLSSYQESSWAYKQAHINGRKAVLQEIKQLLTIG